jgi:membrane dipeptidase
VADRAEQIEQVRQILRGTPLIDGHNDLAEELRQRAGLRISAVDLGRPVEGQMTDIPRLRQGGVGGQFWSVWVPPDLPEPEATRRAFEQLDIVQRFVAAHPDAFELATTADEVERAFAHGRIASLIGLEGGAMISSSLAILRHFQALGVRYMTLTHWLTTRWADAATDPPRHGGLTGFGLEVVREMNRLGMLVDLSHVAPSTMVRALDVTEAPVVFSHSGARAVTDHPRNVPDEILARLPANGGVVMAVFLAGFVSTAAMDYEAEEQAHLDALRKARPDVPRAELDDARRAYQAARRRPVVTLAQVADHIDHLRDIAGIEHVGLGSDFDGGTWLPAGLEDVSMFPNLLAELIARGYSPDDVRRIAGGNVLRLMHEAESVARRIQRERGPSEATIEDLDEAENP